MAIKKKRCRENNKGGMITSVCMYGKSKLYLVLCQDLVQVKMRNFSPF